METRTLGTHGPRVSRLGLGCVTFGREIDEATSFAVLDRALEVGITLFDTAEAYGSALPDGARSYASESILGRWVADRAVRDRVVLETKLTPPLTAARIGAAIDAALGRLRAETIDLFLFHAYDKSTPLDESVAAVARAIEAGKVRHLGASNFDASQFVEADAVARGQGLPGLAVSQSNYNLALPDAAGAIFPTCRAAGIGVQTYSPLGAGFLMGKYTGDRAAMPAGTRFAIAPGHADLYFQPASFDRARRLGEVSDRLGISRATLATAWVLQNDDVDSVLVGAREARQLEAAIAAAELAATFSDLRAELDVR